MIKPIRKPALWPYLKSSSLSYPQTFCFNSGLEISFDFRVLWIREVILSWNFSSRTTILLWSPSNKKRNLGPFYVWNSYLKHGSWQRTLNNAIHLFICLTNVPHVLLASAYIWYELLIFERKKIWLNQLLAFLNVANQDSTRLVLNCTYALIESSQNFMVFSVASVTKSTVFLQVSTDFLWKIAFVFICGVLVLMIGCHW